MTHDRTEHRTQHQSHPSRTGRSAAQPAVTETEFVACPQCDLPATVEWRQEAGSTGGPLEHLKIRCAGGHWFLLPASMVTTL